MMPQTTFKFGDRVVHATRPEWGEAVVTGVQLETHEGSPCQRLTLRFDRAGLKTLSTAVARLLPAAEQEAPAPPAQEAAEEPKGWLDQLASDNPAEAMSRLPEATSDPFSSLGARLRATLSLFRFTDRGGSLLDWAAAQTGLKDPLTRFNRHQLEEFYRRWAMERDGQLRRLIAEMKKKDPAMLESVLADAPAQAREALRRAYAER